MSFLSEDDAVGGFNDHFRSAVAVHVVDRHAVVVSDADRMGSRARCCPRSRLLGPKSTRQRNVPSIEIGFDFLGTGRDVGNAIDHEVVFAVAVQVATQASERNSRLCFAAEWRNGAPPHWQTACMSRWCLFHAADNWPDIIGIGLVRSAVASV